MIKNSIKATVSFDFKGKNYNLSYVVNVDEAIHQEDLYQWIYNAIAINNNIGMYSYELEVLQNSEIEFTNALGYVKKCCTNGSLNLDLLAIEFKKNKVDILVDKLINKYKLDKNDNNILEALREACSE